MNNSQSNNPGSDVRKKDHAREEVASEKIMESSTNTSLLMPVALLLVLLVIPFSINSFMHMLAKKNQFVYPVIMKMPLDSNAIIAPTAARQFESFDVGLRINTQTLAEFINDIVAISSEGTSIQGITGFISPSMKAEITGEGFRIDDPGPQSQLYGLHESTQWKWQVVPESSGVQTIKFIMHVTAIDRGNQKIHAIELAEANIVVDSNNAMWMVYNWWVFALPGLVLFAGWKVLRRYNAS
ncbi:MAG: hypothetical protein IT525_04465 [Nitrosomonas sp.]|jgi:hypothetical protein|nr:hypothetical protein [Nitrosomonas sp.]